MRRELVAASAEPIVLSLLEKGDSYGYAIIQEIRKVSGGRIEWTDGMLYPVLHRLERNKWIQSQWLESEAGPRRKYYSLTRSGCAALAEQQSEWMAVHSTLRHITAKAYV